MRPDMDRLLIQRPRDGHWRPNYVAQGERRQARSLRRDPEAMDRLPRRGSMKPRRARFYDTKHFSDHLTPLYRFLLSRRGRRWDAVYSELRAHLTPRSYLQQHVYEHLWDMVTRHVRVVDGEVQSQSQWGGRFRPLYSRWRWPTFYVDPRDGCLREAPQLPRRPADGPPADRKHVRGDRWHLRLEGIWYAVDLVELHPVGTAWGPLRYEGAPRDACLHQVAHPNNEDARAALYGHRSRVAIRRFQLGRKALRRHGLENHEASAR